MSEVNAYTAGCYGYLEFNVIASEKSVLGGVFEKPPMEQSDWSEVTSHGTN